jgi:hypothetical protein
MMLPACRVAAKHAYITATRCTAAAQFANRKIALFSTVQTDAATPAVAAASKDSPFKNAGLFGQYSVSRSCFFILFDTDSFIVHVLSRPWKSTDIRHRSTL